MIIMIIMITQFLAQTWLEIGGSLVCLKPAPDSRSMLPPYQAMPHLEFLLRELAGVAKLPPGRVGSFHDRTTSLFRPPKYQRKPFWTSLRRHNTYSTNRKPLAM